MRRRGRSERLARSTRQGRSEPRAVQAREMLNRPILVLAPSATLSTEIHTSVPLPNTSFREFFRREALKAVGEPASISSPIAFVASLSRATNPTREPGDFWHIAPPKHRPQ